MATATDGPQKPNEPQQQQVFPPPPPFFMLYRSNADGTAERPLPPLPPPPVSGEYPMFGELHSTEAGIAALTDLQLFQMRPDGTIDFRSELSQLSRELVFNFFELLNVLIENPEAHARQVENIGHVLRNMHYLLNLLRPVQARATLAHTLRLRIQERKQALLDIRQRLEVAQAAVGGVGKELAALWQESPANGQVEPMEEG